MALTGAVGAYGPWSREGSPLLVAARTYCFKCPSFRRSSTKRWRLRHASAVCPWSLWYAHFLLRFLSMGFDLIGPGHLKLGNSRTIGSNFSYVNVRGVRVIGWRRSTCPLLDGPCWLEGLKFLVVSFLAVWPVTSTCCVVARTSSSSMEYLFACRNRSSMVVGSFLARDSKKGVPGYMLRLKICRMTSML